MNYWPAPSPHPLPLTCVCLCVCVGRISQEMLNPLQMLTTANTVLWCFEMKGTSQVPDL